MILLGKNYSGITMIEGENILCSTEKVTYSSVQCDLVWMRSGRKYSKEQSPGRKGTWCLILNIQPPAHQAGHLWPWASPSAAQLLGFGFLACSWRVGNKDSAPLSSDRPRQAPRSHQMLVQAQSGFHPRSPAALLRHIPPEFHTNAANPNLWQQ